MNHLIFSDESINKQGKFTKPNPSVKKVLCPRNPLSWAKFYAFLEQNPLASPGRLTDLIAMSRGGSAMAK